MDGSYELFGRMYFKVIKLSLLVQVGWQGYKEDSVAELLLSIIFLHLHYSNKCQV
jgi:hypothetical protein